MLVLVFRLTAFDEDQLVAWVESLQSRAPGSKLLLVGTHLDECEEGQADEVLEQAECAVRDWGREQVQRLDVMIDAAKEAVAADAANQSRQWDRQTRGCSRTGEWRHDRVPSTEEHGKPVCAAPFGLQSTERIEVE